MNSQLAILSDIEIKALLRAGDYRAYKEVYERYWPILYTYARKLIDDEFVAQDAVQDALVHIWEKREKIEIRTSLSGYLYTTVRHTILANIRRQGLYSKYVNGLAEFLDQGVYTTDSAVLEHEIHAFLDKAIADLPPKMRRVYVLSRIENYSKEEVAKKLNISEATVKKQVENSLSKIREKLKHLHIFW